MKRTNSLWRSVGTLSGTGERRFLILKVPVGNVLPATYRLWKTDLNEKDVFVARKSI
jgi:hypothetical protein